MHSTHGPSASLSPGDMQVGFVLSVLAGGCSAEEGGFRDETRSQEEGGMSNSLREMSGRLASLEVNVTDYFVAQGGWCPPEVTTKERMELVARLIVRGPKESSSHFVFS